MAYHVSPTRKIFSWKYLTVLLLSIIALSSCDIAFGFNSLNYSRLNIDLETAWRETASYRYMLDTNNDWKSPREFERDGGGDCEDFAIHLMYHLGDSSTLYVVKLNGRKTYHAIVGYKGSFIEPQVYNYRYDPSEFTVVYQWGYTASMLFVTNGGSKNILQSGSY